MARQGYLKGKLLIAMPSVEGDDFNRSVIFICDHSADGAMGLVINKPAPRMIFADLIEKLDLGKPVSLTEDHLQLPVMLGGPVRQFQGFVLHSPDFKVAETLVVSKEFAVTTTVDVLRDIALGKGPSRKLLALGYAGWTAGQLDDEILRNTWLSCDADADLVFSGNPDHIYENALAKLGVAAGNLSPDAGHA